jgi:hypothetical protein
MILDKNGIKVDVSTDGHVLYFRVLEQSEEATEALTLLGQVHDDGFTLRSNKFPAFNRKTKKFFVRGRGHKKDDRKVTVEFKSAKEATDAMEALDRLLDKVRKPQINLDDPRDIVVGRAIVRQGGTSHVRMAFINKEKAKRLELTGHDNYPNEVVEWKPCEPVVTNNRHYNEHIAQVVDVLNKSVQDDNDVLGHVINPHRVTQAQAKKAIKAVRKLFDDAERDDYLVAIWRVVTGIRGPDAVD